MNDYRIPAAVATATLWVTLSVGLSAVVGFSLMVVVTVVVFPSTKVQRSQKVFKVWKNDIVNTT